MTASISIVAFNPAWVRSGLINALMKMLVVSHEALRAEGLGPKGTRAGAKRRGVPKAQNGTLLALRA
jgi:hypothetical protein